MSRRVRTESEFAFSQEKLLKDGIIKRNLILSALFLFAYEVLKQSILDDVFSFLVFDDTEEQVAADKAELRKLDRNKWTASCLFLEDLGIISHEDLDAIGEIEEHRNTIAHEMPRLLLDQALDVNIAHLNSIVRILQEVDRWRKEFDVLPMHPELDVDEVYSGRMMIVGKIMWDVLSEYMDLESTEPTAVDMTGSPNGSTSQCSMS